MAWPGGHLKGSEKSGRAVIDDGNDNANANANANADANASANDCDREYYASDDSTAT